MAKFKDAGIQDISLWIRIAHLMDGKYTYQYYKQYYVCLRCQERWIEEQVIDL